MSRPVPGTEQSGTKQSAASRTRRWRLLPLLAGLTVLSACGFTPVYGDRSPTRGPDAVAREMAAIDVGLIANRPGQILRNDLIHRLGTRTRHEAPRYRLQVTLAEQEQQLGIERDATSTRAALRIIARYSLIRVADGTVLLSDAVRSVNSFTIHRTTEAVYNTIAAREDARHRGLRTVATRIVNRIALLLSPATDPGGGG